MSKWRPTDKNCLYAIGDIHGKYKQLKLILNRVLPLRKSDGGKDMLIFLGDYIDRDMDSHKVIDTLINLKEKYPTQIIFIKGNHEVMMQNGIINSLNSSKYMLWMENGGQETLAGYIKRANIKPDEDFDSFPDRYIKNPYLLPRSRIADFIPKEHIKFIDETQLYYETDEYIFTHAGWDPGAQAHEQDSEGLLWGNPLISTVAKYKSKNIPLPWDKTIVVGHYWKGPFIYDKYMMIDMSGTKELMIVELHSKEAFIAKPNKARLVSYSTDGCFPFKKY